MEEAKRRPQESEQANACAVSLRGMSWQAAREDEKNGAHRHPHRAWALGVALRRDGEIREWRTSDLT